ncbi:SRPBCC domain-containing protein [Streptosporangium sp. 'caverna']|uniref:SRPBCC domain-containing protein n=1 Tax=Streptosporangium sp. 'caverna' TaxID=2202249 RepID=UPI000D7E6D85|nr:SRPBCC domain-containing protein [Streptosporangium sp. 'caverna']AWS45485.1 SRPBCC domain-containing protein [Streptosporangium sp. 'caverna']
MSYVITAGVDINAGKEAVWDVLVDFARYGEWSNFSRAEGTARVGSRLTMRMPGFSFRPTVAVAEPGEQLQWAGTLLAERLFHGRHSFILVAKPDGTTHLTNHEEFSGALTTLTQRFMKQNGDNGYTAFNAGLKRQVESRTQQWNRT